MAYQYQQPNGRTSQSPQPPHAGSYQTRYATTQGSQGPPQQQYADAPLSPYSEEDLYTSSPRRATANGHAEQQHAFSHQSAPSSSYDAYQDYQSAYQYPGTYTSPSRPPPVPPYGAPLSPPGQQQQPYASAQFDTSHIASYNPADYSQYGSYPPQYSSNYAGTYNPSAGRSSQQYAEQAHPGPPVPPRPHSSTVPSMTTSSTYSQPQPMTASTYMPSSTRPPYPEYDTTATYMPGFEPPDFDTVSQSINDEFNHSPAPVVPSSARNSRQSFASENMSLRHNSTASRTSIGDGGVPLGGMPLPPPPPTHGLSRTSPSLRHPTSRPLPGPPPEASDQQRSPGRVNTDLADYQDRLIDEIGAYMSPGERHQAATYPVAPETHSVPRTPQRVPVPDRRRSGLPSNSNSPIGNASQADSDAEAAAGLQAMRMADEEDARLPFGTWSNSLRASMTGPSPTYDTAIGGGLPSPSSGMQHGRPRVHDREMSFDSMDEVLQSLPAGNARAGARGIDDVVDSSQGSYPDDGDAYSFVEDASDTLGSQDPYFPNVSSMYRPLPPPPSWSTESVPGHTPAMTPPSATGLPHSQSEIAVPRFSSLREYSSTPPVGHPTRSKTDAEDRLRRAGLGVHTSAEYRSSAMLTLPATPAANTMIIDLPSLPSKRFSVAKLTANDFKRCEEPWALSAIYQWIRFIANPEQVTELKESTIRDAIVALFTFKIPTINDIDAEVLAQQVIREMYDAGVLRPTEEWVRLVPGEMRGVLVQITSGGCYSPFTHIRPMPAGKCYSSRCQRTLRKESTRDRGDPDWATHYKLTAVDVEGKEKKEIERQNILHEIVTTEHGYMDRIDVLQHVYRDALAMSQGTVMDQRKLTVFLRDVFGKIDAVRKSNEDYLLPQLKYMQDDQGPWIVGFSDIFRQWIRKARQPYIDYAAAFPAASLTVRQEMSQNFHFRTFLDNARANKASNRLDFDTYLKAPITRLQRYSLLLDAVHKCMKEDSVEKTSLHSAIEEIREVTKECDSRVAEMSRKVELSDFGTKLVLRPEIKAQVELNLNFLGRRLVHQGDLLRTRSTKLNWVDCHAILFDHYLVLAKPFGLRGAGSKLERYDVSRFPIPMDLLVLESFDEDPVKQGTYIKALTTTVATTPSSRPSGVDLLRGRTGTGSSSTLDRPASGASSSTTVAASSTPTMTVTEASKDADKILYPFKIKHLGLVGCTYSLFANSANQRSEWKAKLVEAKTLHAKLLHDQNSEPFKLKIIADSAFFYDSATHVAGSRTVMIDNTPMQRAIQDVEARYKDSSKPGPVCRARINCATCFNKDKLPIFVVGTDFGVYVSHANDPRNWSKVIAMVRITQVAVLEEFGILLLISSGSLIAYPLDVITETALPANGGDAVTKKAPQKLSGAKDVGFFAVGKMKDRTLVFYKKRDGLSSTFKVLEPVYKRSTEPARGLFSMKRGTTEFFRDYDEFYIPAECGGMNLFANSLSVSTSRGFEVLNLDKKQTFSVPDIRAPEVEKMAQSFSSQTTLGMLRLSDQEFILCYERTAVYVNKYGDVSRSITMDFVGKATAAALHGVYLLLFGPDFIEIRNAQNGRLKQIVSGRDIRCIDDGGSGSLSGGSINPSGIAGGVVNGGTDTNGRTVKVAMAHPANERCQIIVELVLNQDLKE